MALLIGFAFLAGVITILSPCILPILPIVLSGSLGSRKKPFGIITGFVLSFTFFTLFLATIVKATGISADSLRFISIIIIFLFGLSLLLPQFQTIMEKLFSKLAGKFTNQGTHEGFWGGVLIGLSLGLIWTPCVGPIIASVITLAATSEVTFGAFMITLAYSLGTALPMLTIMYGGRGLLRKIPWLLQSTARIQKAFGVIMVLTAVGIFLNIDRTFQTYILQKFPQYGVGLTRFEDNSTVKDSLKKLFNRESKKKDMGKPSFEMESFSPSAPELIPGGEWFNLPVGEAGSQPLTIEGLKGKVVLVDFWTYTCINCIRTLPYLKSWHEKYKDDGLVIIGVHTPEFAFEREAGNVRKAIEDFEIEYPVVQDNEYQTWKAYNNQYWPAKYLIDSHGKVRKYHFGEGAYAEMEESIRELLKEAGKNVSGQIKSDEINLNSVEISQETYLGSRRMQYLNPEGSAGNGSQSFTLEPPLPNSFSLGGMWNITDEYAEAKDKSALEYNFQAKKVFLVMRPIPGEKQTVKVLIDGKAITSAIAGKDVENGIVTLDTDRLYELVNISNGVENHVLRLEFSSGIQSYAFTFGG